MLWVQAEAWLFPIHEYFLTAIGYPMDLARSRRVDIIGVVGITKLSRHLYLLALDWARILLLVEARSSMGILIIFPSGTGLLATKKYSMPRTPIHGAFPTDYSTSIPSAV